MTIDKDELINKLQTGIHRLIELYEQEKAQNSILKQRINELSNLLLEKEKETMSLETKYNTLRMAKTLSETGDTLETKVKVNNLVRELDKCIALLNR